MKAKSKTTAKTSKPSTHKRDSIRIAYLASLIENISDALISTDLDFHILEWNAAAESLYGWTEAEVIGHPVQAFIQTEYHSTTSADMIKFVLEAGTWKGEVTQNRKDGSRFPVWAAVSQVRDETGKQIGFVTINRDITERKSAELQVIQMKRLYATLSQVNQTIVRVKDREDLYQSICDVSVNFGEFSVAWVGLLDAASGDVYPTAANGLDVNHWPFPIVNLKTGPRSEGSIARAFHTSQVVTSGDMQTDEHLQSLHDQFHQSGFQSSAVIPFRLRGKTIGTLTLISHEEGLFKDAEELRLLDEMGLDISFALDSMETEAERKRAQEKIERQNQRLKILREIDIAILAADSVENIVGAALSHVRELMDCQRANLTLIDRGTDELVIFDAKTVSETSIPAGSRLPVALFQDIIQTLSQNQPILFSDYRTVVDPMPGIQRLLKDGLLSTCSLPLFSQDSLIGMFSMHSEIPGFFDDEKIALGREVANQVAVALTQNHLVEGLRESEEKYRAFFENSLDAILLTSPDGSIQAANPAACRMFGRTEAEICALSRNELVDTNDPRAAALLEERTKTGKAFGELTMFRNDGSPFPVDMSSALFQDRQGNARTSMIIRDVTERKQTENDLRESEQKFSILFNKAPFAISLSKLPAGVIVEINEEFEKLVGYSRQEAVGQTSLELNLYPDPELRARTKAEFDKHGFARNIETVIQRKTGELRYVLASTDAIEIVGEKLLLSTAQDITERKRAEEQLQYQAHLLENVNDAIVASDAQFTLKAWNSAAERIYGWKAEEVLGRNGVEILQTRFSEADAEEMRRQIAELGHYVGEATQLRRDGTLVPVEVASMVLLDDDGKITGYVSVNREITERKQAEAALGIEVERFKRFVESNIVGIVIANAAGKIITANDYYLNILGVTRQDFEDGNVDWRKFTPPEWLPADEKALRELQERGVCEPYEKEYVRRDGGRVPVYIADAMLPGPEKQIAAFVLDITERKQAEAAVRESGRRIDAIIASAMDAIISIDADQHILLLNAAAEQMFQCRATEVIGQTLERFIPERFHASHRRFIELFDRDGTTNRAMGHLTALTGVRANGEEFPIEASISQVGVTDKKVFTVILRDITERTRAEEQIKSQLQRLNALHSIDIAISSSFDIHVTLDVVLQQVLAQLGVDAAAILLLHPELETLEYAASRGFHSDVLHSPRLKLEEGYAGRAVLDRKTVHVSNGMELGGTLARSLHLKNESFIEYYGTPLIVKGEVEGVLEIYHRSPLDLDPEWQDFLEMLAGQAAIAIDNAQLLHDLQRSNAELEERVAKRTEELNRMNIELEHANRAKDEFLANMSHELRTPLNGILGVSETLLEQRRDPITEYQQRSLQIIQSSGSHLLELINDILDLSKIEARKFDYYPQILSVEELCRSSLIFVKQQAIRKSMTITYREETAGSRVYADPRRLKQILVNLLTNAVKFTPEHGQVTLQVHIDPELDRIQFSVIDNGIGIAPEDLQQLFVPFKQVDSSFTRNHEGTGLGLALVQKLTEMHGGSVDVESEVGNGSRFTVNLPWEQTIVAHEEANQTVGELVPATPSRKSNAAEGERLDRGIILLAEDNLANILTMSDYLETHGYQVVVAHDGAEAIEKAEQIHPHLILMDIQMPVMDGLDATARFRNNPRFASTPIIALTALAMPGDRERCLKAGANEYMSKPVSLKMLMKTIRQLLGQEE